MNAGPALVLALLLTAGTGCGSFQRPRAEERAGPSTPTWGGCHAHSVQSIDYGADARGASTQAKALAPYRESGDHLVRRPERPHRNPAWLLVDQHDVIHAAVETWHTDRGWVVSTVDRCPD